MSRLGMLSNMVPTLAHASWTAGSTGTQAPRPLGGLEPFVIPLSTSFQVLSATSSPGFKVPLNSCPHFLVDKSREGSCL